MDFDSNKFSYNLVSLMEENNMKQNVVADQIGVSEVTISRYISGKRTPRLDIIIKIANLFNVSTDFLLGISSNPNKLTSSGNLNTDISEIAHKLYSLKSDEHLSQKQIEFIKNMIITNKDLVLSYHKK